MAKLSKLTESSSAQDAANALHGSSDNRLELKGGSEGQAWKLYDKAKTEADKKEIASGSIPLSSHNAKNLPVALKALIKARTDHHITD